MEINSIVVLVHCLELLSPLNWDRLPFAGLGQLKNIAYFDWHNDRCEDTKSKCVMFGCIKMFIISSLFLKSRLFYAIM